MRAIHHGASRAVVKYLDEYLTKARGEPPGRWMGRGAALLGRYDEVDSWDFQRILEGHHPRTGERLGGEFTTRYRKDGKAVSSVIGFDPTFSAPKSLSVWWALTGDEGLAECHDVAVAAAMDAIERRAATTRVRSNGTRTYLDTEGLIAAAFRQSTSRADDPQLHTHVVISSKVRTADGRWLALDARNLMKHQSTFGRVYQAALRAEVTRRYGVAWGEVKNGQAEIAGFPIELLGLFSKRAEEIDIELRERLDEFRSREGREASRYERSAIEREVATDTRDHKTGLTAAELRIAWEAEATAIGYGLPDIESGVSRAASRHLPTGVLPTPESVIVGLAEERSTWQHLDVVRWLADHTQAPPDCDGLTRARRLDALAVEVTAASRTLDPPAGASPIRRSDGRSIWTDPTETHATSDLVLAQEQRISTWSLDAQQSEPTSAPISADGLDPGQHAAAEAVAGADPMVLVVGPAGAGKTTMLRAAAGRLGHDRRPVIGLAPTAKAARVLASETGMPADTVAKLLHEHRARPEQLDVPNGATVIIDEAGMLGTADFFELVELADRHRWRLVLVGDPQQLSAVGRGGMFAHLCERSRVFHLDQLHRFTNEWESDATLRLRAADTSVVAEYAERDRLVPGDLDDQMAAIADHWFDCRRRGVSLSITTTRNDDVDQINRHIQRGRLRAGQLDPDSGIFIAGSPAFVGDVVATRRNDRTFRSGDDDYVRNRERWTTEAIDSDGSLTLAEGDRRVVVSADYAKQFVALAYATTEHGAQGITTDESITLVTDATTQRGLYVGATRGRQRNAVHVAAPDLKHAIERLECVIETDRIDVPAIEKWRRLTKRVGASARATPRSPAIALPVPEL
ncbi:MAG: MobF family relaxase [Ilumatobacter sp.]|uniref:MobF family relaxase n=1 Tax=Ilumatobacter sp. TaxID=1967498 RepID=UPI0026292E57|nr:MobF family relaxase [Ilumatobacter sp.]MDJ0771314.1 MobF family relaxase [Ilumatobacter sp.]